MADKLYIRVETSSDFTKTTIKNREKWSRDLWTNEKTELFIQTVHQHPSLWDSRTDEFRKPNVKNQAWEAVSNDVGIDETECRNRFKCLSNTWRKNFAKAKFKTAGSKRSGSGTDDIYKPKWEFYQALSFLEHSAVFGQGKSYLATTGATQPPSDCPSQPVERQSELVTPQFNYSQTPDATSKLRTTNSFDSQPRSGPQPSDDVLMSDDASQEIFTTSSQHTASSSPPRDPTTIIWNADERSVPPLSPHPMREFPRKFIDHRPSDITVEYANGGILSANPTNPSTEPEKQKDLSANPPKPSVEPEKQENTPLDTPYVPRRKKRRSRSPESPTQESRVDINRLEQLIEKCDTLATLQNDEDEVFGQVVHLELKKLRSFDLSLREQAHLELNEVLQKYRRKYISKKFD